MNKLLVICGPTATGKTSLGVHLAKIFKGEIVSADSRQVYRGLDTITGKDIGKKFPLQIENSRLRIESDKFTVGYRLLKNIPVWLVDIVEPDYIFNVGEYKKLADKVIADITSRNLLPIVVGGSGLYINALTVKMDFIIIPPNKSLRKELSKLTRDELALRLQNIDYSRWQGMNESDRSNPRRLVRAIEINQAFKDKNIDTDIYKNKSTSDILIIGLTTPSKQKLYEFIAKRIKKRLEENVLEEVEGCFEKKYDPSLPALSASGYKPLLQYLERTISLQTAIRNWGFVEHEYARRQLTWFKRDKRILWFDITERNFRDKIEETVRKWYTSK